MLNDDDGDSKRAVCLTQRLEDQRGAGGVECRGGLVENQDARTHGEDGSDGHLLLLSAREGGDLAVTQVADADGLERFTTRRSIWSWGTPKFSRPKSISSSTTEATICVSISCSTLPTICDTSVSEASQVSWPSTMTDPKNVPV